MQNFRSPVRRHEQQLRWSPDIFEVQSCNVNVFALLYALLYAVGKTPLHGADLTLAPACPRYRDTVASVRACMSEKVRFRSDAVLPGGETVPSGVRHASCRSVRLSLSGCRGGGLLRGGLSKGFAGKLRYLFRHRLPSSA